MKTLQSISLIFLIIFNPGCTFYQITSNESGNNLLPSKNNISEVKYLEIIDQPHQVIGIVTVTTERRQTLENIIPKMQYEAAMLGADAITDIQTDATGAWKKIQPKSLLGNAYIRSNYTAKAIIFNKSTNKPESTDLK